VTTGWDVRNGLVAATAVRSTEIVDALGVLDEKALGEPSHLPGWSRLTIACHLRYGAEALCRMTEAAIAGQPTSYYPDRREVQRSQTLRPLPAESPMDVVTSLGERSTELDRAWRTVDDQTWKIDVVEPRDNPDLGTIELARLPLLRLTEVEVHGSDLGLGLDDWSELFVRVALPMRLEWINTRRSNHRDFDADLDGSWLIVATDGPIYKVTVKGTRVESRPAESTSSARATIEASSRDLLALMVGRRLRHDPGLSGDIEFAEAFRRAFPGP
jgi:uncharacterized protein (TIGR03083 family)